MEFQVQSGIYQQIALQVMERIASGEWPAGGRIPSVRDLATEIVVNPNTVMRAYAQLQEDGILTNQRGVGFFVAAEGPEKVRQFKKEAFIRELLPQVFRDMAVLGMNWEELQAHYDNFQLLTKNTRQ